MDTININLNKLDMENINHINLKKMIFIYNALENGWSISKKDKNYIFKKNHEGKKEILADDYLKRFMKENIDINSILN